MNSKVPDSELGKLKWRCRRGLLENDLFIERFFKHHEASLTREQTTAITELMELSDVDLLDLFLSRKTLAQINKNLDRPDMQAILELFLTTQ